MDLNQGVRNATCGTTSWKTPGFFCRLHRQLAFGQKQIMRFNWAMRKTWEVRTNEWLEFIARSSLKQLPQHSSFRIEKAKIRRSAP